MSLLYRYNSVAVSLLVLQYRWPHSTRPTIAQLILFAVYTALAYCISVLQYLYCTSVLQYLYCIRTLYWLLVMVLVNTSHEDRFLKGWGAKAPQEGNLLLYVLHQSYFSTINVLKFFLVYECQHCSCLHHYWNIANVFRARICSWFLSLKECIKKYCP